MEIWQIVLLSYAGALLVWLIINAIFLLISFMLKRKIFITVELLTSILSVILGLATFIGDIALVVWLFSNNQIVWGVIAIALGFGVVSFAGSILSMPFTAITGAFSAWYDEIN